MWFTRISGRLSAASKTANMINGFRKSTPLFSSGIVQQRKLIHCYTPLERSCLLHNRVIGGHTSLARDSTLTPSTLQRFGFSSSASPVHDAKGSENSSIIENELDKRSDQKKKRMQLSENSDAAFIDPNCSGGNSTNMESTLNDSDEVEDNSAKMETTQNAEAVQPEKTWWDIFTRSGDGSGDGSGGGCGGGDCGGGDF